MNIQHNIEWPGSPGSSNGRWNELRNELDKLHIGGPSAAFLFEDETEVNRARTSVFSYGEMQGAKKRGWRYQTTARDTTLYVRKVAIGRVS